MFKRSSLLIGMVVLAGLVAPSVQAKGKCKNGVCRMAAVNKALKQHPVIKQQVRGKGCKNGVCPMAVRGAVLRKQAVRKAVLRRGCKNGVCKMAAVKNAPKQRPVVKQQPKAVKKVVRQAKVAAKRRVVKQQPKMMKRAFRNRR